MEFWKHKNDRLHVITVHALTAQIHTPRITLIAWLPFIKPQRIHKAWSDQIPACKTFVL